MRRGNIAPNNWLIETFTYYYNYVGMMYIYTFVLWRHGLLKSIIQTFAGFFNLRLYYPSSILSMWLRSVLKSAVFPRQAGQQWTCPNYKWPSWYNRSEDIVEDLLWGHAMDERQKLPRTQGYFSKLSVNERPQVPKLLKKLRNIYINIEATLKM